MVSHTVLSMVSAGSVETVNAGRSKSFVSSTDNVSDGQLVELAMATTLYVSEGSPWTFVVLLFTILPPSVTWVPSE